LIKPPADSDIRFEVWLPPSLGWNHRYQQVSNGGLAGVINYRQMVIPLERGMATARTDDGHENDQPFSAVGHPEKLINYGYRAVHLTDLWVNPSSRRTRPESPSRTSR
jgi:feruloyl esterase